MFYSIYTRLYIFILYPNIKRSQIKKSAFLKGITDYSLSFLVGKEESFIHCGGNGSVFRPLPQFVLLYSGRIKLYLQLSRPTNLFSYSNRTTTVRVIQLESIPLGRLLPHYREPHTLFRMTKNCSVTELHGL